jgi:nitrogen fixation/metabolism regulation signal transduction histidine kinase
MSEGRSLRELRDFLLTLGVAAPPALVAAWSNDHPSLGWWPLAGAMGASVVIALGLRGSLARRLRTMTSVLASFREGDLSVRARLARGGAVFDDVLSELNQLGDTLREHRLGELEAWALLRTVMAEIDVVVLAFDDDDRVRLANDVAARLLGVPAAALAGRPAKDLRLDDLLRGEAPRAVRDSAVLGPGPWELRRGAFRLSGRLHSLVVLADVSGALREQERDAWKRLIRVMGHEINNSLAPIQSIAQSMLRAQALPQRAADWEQDLTSGLSVVARRAEALGRFMSAYAQLARLPRPQLRDLDVGEWVRRATVLEQRVVVEIVGGPDVTVRGDADQLDQLLINLVKNAVDATQERESGEVRAGVRVSWTTAGRELELAVEDDGPGVADTANLFVPFFTTKPGGSGIGLALARQIAEAHGGQVSLRNRDGATGARAVVRLPLPRPSI